MHRTSPQSRLELKLSLREDRCQCRSIEGEAWYRAFVLRALVPNSIEDIHEHTLEHIMTKTTNPREVSVQEGYTRWAAQYDQEDNALIALEEKLALPLLSTIPANHVLDLGAGTGRYALRLAARGAQVTALDQSAAMLARAKQAADQAGLSVQFSQRGLDRTLPGEAQSYDLIVAALVLCHIENIASLAQEAYRVLRTGGHILISDFHPAVIAAGWRTQFSSQEGTYLLPTAHRTRDDYLSALIDAGFCLETVEEGLVRDVPAGSLPADLIRQDGGKPFCLVILASKPRGKS